jgi:hypothetical protein
VLTLGLPDSFVEHGDPAKLLAQCGLDAAGIEQSSPFGTTRGTACMPSFHRALVRPEDRSLPAP